LPGQYLGPAQIDIIRLGHRLSFSLSQPQPPPRLHESAGRDCKHCACAPAPSARLTVPASRSPASGSLAPVLPARSALQQLQLGRSATRLLPDGCSAGRCSCSVLSRVLGCSTGVVALASRSIVLVLQLSSRQAGSSPGIQLQCSTQACSVLAARAPARQLHRPQRGSSTRQRIWPKKVSLYIM
jgi:hypothetical protein